VYISSVAYKGLSRLTGPTEIKYHCTAMKNSFALFYINLHFPYMYTYETKSDFHFPRHKNLHHKGSTLLLPMSLLLNSFPEN